MVPADDFAADDDEGRDGEDVERKYGGIAGRSLGALPPFHGASLAWGQGWPYRG
jgi:hypothetical protein